MLRVVIFLLLSAASAFAQTGQGSIVGSVTDSSSGVIPGVAVRAQHAGTGFAYNAITTDEGIYRLLYLNPGIYEITYESPGFKKLVRGNVAVRSTETVR